MVHFFAPGRLGASNKETHFSFLFFFSYPPFKAPPSFRAGLWNPAIQWPGRFSGITGRDPHVSKSNWLRVVIFRVFSLYHFEVYGYVPLKRLVIFLGHPPSLFIWEVFLTTSLVLCQVERQFHDHESNCQPLRLVCVILHYHPVV
jgi:hypothetical protein